MTAGRLAKVLKDHADVLMGIPGVVGVGEGRVDDTPCIVVMVASRTPEIEAAIPREIEGHPVDIRVTGEFKAR